MPLFLYSHEANFMQGFSRKNEADPALYDVAFLSSHEANFMQGFSRNKKREASLSFNCTVLYIEDALLSLNYSKFGDYLDPIQPTDIEIKDTKAQINLLHNLIYI